MEDELMLICPSCGWPHEGSPLGGGVHCDFCKWSGDAAELLRISGELSDYPQIVERLKALSQAVSTDIGKRLAQLVVHYGLIQADPSFAPLLATVTRNACNAAFKSVLLDLFPEKGALDGNGSEPR